MGGRACSCKTIANAKDSLTLEKVADQERRTTVIVSMELHDLRQIRDFDFREVSDECYLFQ